MSKLPTNNPYRLNPLSGSRLGDWARILVMGGLVAGLIWFAFFFETPVPPPTNMPVSGPIKVSTPSVDQVVLAEVRDDTRQERLLLEPAPLAHLLEISLQVVPTVARALGMPEDPLPIEVLRASPGIYRGSYLWYGGKLEYISNGKSGHPVEGYRVYDGWIVTDEGEKVLFRVSRLDPEMQVGDWVRVEGFFLKLRDSHHMPEVDQAPLLVGPELFNAYEPWPPVTALDPALLGEIRDGKFSEQGMPDVQQADLDLRESQSDQLWHLAAYAMERRRSGEFMAKWWREQPAFVTEDQFYEFKFDEVERGTPIRLLGTYVMSRSFAARPNPIGVDTWTEVWVQIRDLGGKLMPVWVPRQVEGLMYNQSLEVRAYYFRKYVYESHDRQMRFAPLFVAADIDRFRAADPHPMDNVTKGVFVALVVGIILLFFWNARRDRRAREELDETLSARRRKRRERAQQAGADA